MTPRPDADAATLASWFAARLRPLDGSDAEAVAASHEEETGESPLIPAAVLVGLAARAAGLNLILTRRADTLSRHSGQVALPGGRCEPGETFVEAALREAWEEIGLDPDFVRPIGLGDPYRTRTGFEITPVVAFLDPGFALAPAPDEVAEVFETPFAFLMDPANHEVRTWTGPDGSIRSYYAMPHDGPLIWGVTAGVLRSLYERLFMGQPT